MFDQHSVRRLQGFGGVGHGDCYLSCPRTVEEIGELLQSASRGVVVRGEGQSYGDASVLSESIALSLQEFGEIEIDEGGLAQVDAGVTVGRLCHVALLHGFWSPVVSGTGRPSIGGALGMNIHGKNAFHAGTLGEHVRKIEVVTGGGQHLFLTPAEPDFWKFVGGAGWFGVIVRAWIQLVPVESPSVRVKAEKSRDWPGSLAQLSDLGSEDYAVGWIDVMRGGRGVFHFARYADAPSATHEKSKLVQTAAKAVLRSSLNRTVLSGLNWAKYATSSRKSVTEHLFDFSFLLDSIPGWQAMYGCQGFYQVQLFVPEEGALAVFNDVTRHLQRLGRPPQLAVLKRHRVTTAPGWALNYTVDGFSLALDFARNGRESTELSPLMDLALDAGGKLYLAKDQLMTPEQFLRCIGPESYQEIRLAKRRFDPRGILGSVQAARLGIGDPV